MSSQSSSLSLNTDYIKSRIGILRILEAVIGVCGIICVNEGAYCGRYGMYSFYNFVVTTTLILAIIILIIFLFGIDKLCAAINCPMSVFINDVVFLICYIIAAILMFITIGICKSGMVARIFAALFGVCGTIVVGLLALDGYQTFRGNQSAPKSEPA